MVKFYSWFYNNFIYEDWWDMKPIGIWILFIPYFIRVVLFHLMLPIFAIFYLVKKSRFYTGLIEYMKEVKSELVKIGL